MLDKEPSCLELPRCVPLLPEIPQSIEKLVALIRTPSDRRAFTQQIVLLISEQELTVIYVSSRPAGAGYRAYSTQPKPLLPGLHPPAEKA